MPRFPRSVILRAGEPRELLKNKAPNSSVIPEARRGGGAAQGEAGGGCRLLLWGTRDRRENPPPGWEHAWASQNLSRPKLCHVQGSWKGFARGLYPPGLLWKAGGEGAQVWSTVRPAGSQTLGFWVSSPVPSLLAPWPHHYTPNRPMPSRILQPAATPCRTMLLQPVALFYLSVSCFLYNCLHE